MYTGPGLLISTQVEVKSFSRFKVRATKTKKGVQLEKTSNETISSRYQSSRYLDYNEAKKVSAERLESNIMTIRKIITLMIASKDTVL